MATFTEACQRVYFPTEGYTQGMVCLINCMLYNLWTDLHPDDRAREFDEQQVERNIAICRANVEDAGRNTPLVLEHSLEQIQALLMLVSASVLSHDQVRCSHQQTMYFLETSRPFLGWKFASGAARLCQDAGYHCLKLDSGVDKAKEKLMSFWNVYAMEKGLALSLGRCSNLPEYDVTATKFDTATEGGPNIPFFRLWIDIADWQADVYRLIYSNRAQLEPSETKIARARELAPRMQALRDQLFAVLSFRRKEA